MEKKFKEISSAKNLKFGKNNSIAKTIKSRYKIQFSQQNYLNQ